VPPPGYAIAPPAVAAMPGGPQDPSQQAAAGGPGGPGGASAISPIEPIQGASPELAAAGAGPEKMGAAAGSTGKVEPHDGDDSKEGAPPNQALNVPGAPAKTPGLAGPPTAGGSKDPKSVTDGPMPKPQKVAAHEFVSSMFPDAPKSPSYIGAPVELPSSPTRSAAALAAMLRSRSQR